MWQPPDPAARLQPVEDARQRRAFVAKAGMQVVDGGVGMPCEVGEHMRLSLRQPYIAKCALDPQSQRVSRAFERGRQSRRVVIIHTNMYNTKSYIRQVCPNSAPDLSAVCAIWRGMVWLCWRRRQHETQRMRSHYALENRGR